MYLRGLYVAQNYTEARIRFQQAAEKGMAAGWNGGWLVGWVHWWCSHA
jgi:TPR repeat protein